MSVPVSVVEGRVFRPAETAPPPTPYLPPRGKGEDRETLSEGCIGGVTPFAATQESFSR